MFAFAQPERQTRIEWLQLLSLVGLMVVGVIFIYSATLAHEANAIPLYKEAFVRQIVWYAIGLAAGAALCLIDYRSLSRWALVGYGITIVALVLVLIPGVGTTHGWGALRWIDLGPFQFQPSEFAKIGFILAFSNFLSRPVEELRIPANFFKALGMIPSF
jgi:cell division protein FtsW (lipid II flippase)